MKNVLGQEMKLDLHCIVVVWGGEDCPRQECVRRIDPDWVNGFNSLYLTKYVYEKPFFAWINIRSNQ